MMLGEGDTDIERENLQAGDLGRLGSFLGFRLRRVQNQLARDFAVRTASWKLRAGMFSALEIITADPGISQAVLSGRIGLDKSAVVPLVDDLERRGWITRTRSTEDRRRNHLYVTETGRTELDLLVGVMAETESIALGVLSEEEREVISRALDKVYAAYVSQQREG
jgi:DNA-binding MarR family transcriptional regulator